MTTTRFLLVVVWSIACGSALQAADVPRDLFTEPSSPEASLAQMVVRPGLRVELVAAEPLVVDPVSFAWSGDGKLWVVEMNDYPLGLDGRGKPGGRVKFLTDDDGDGRYDRSTTFLEGLTYPTAVQPWRDGVLVCAVPEIFFAADADGDGRADRRETLYEGLKVGNSQHLANGLRWGVDGWLHCGNGGTNTSVRSLKLDRVIDVGTRDFRIRPATGEVEPLAGRSQYVRACDDWGNWFGSHNSEPLFHFVLEDRFLRRNPFVVYPPPQRVVPEVPGAAPIFPLSRTVSRFNDLNKAGRFTSACGLTIYRDRLLGDEFYGNAFICEPVHNLVHREVVERDGPTFRSRRADDERQSEFLASRDPWFRPVMARTGPDGALYIADMYRLVIEHPEWIPKAWQAELDLRAGSDRGRIYRIVPEKGELRRVPRLDRASVEELTAMVDTPNGTLRDLALQRLIDDPREETTLFVRRVARHPRTALGRFALMSASAAMDDPRPGTIALAMDEDVPPLRGAAVLLAPLSGKTEEPNGQAMNRLVTLAADADAGVRLRAALRLGEVSRSDAPEALGKILVHSANDPFLRAAAQSSLTKQKLFLTVRAAVDEASVSKIMPTVVVEALVDTVAGYDDRPSLALLLRTALEDGPPSDRPAAVAALLDGLARHKRSLAALRETTDAGLRGRVEELVAYLETARRTTADATASENDRIAGLLLFGREPLHRDAELAVLGNLLSAATPVRLRNAAFDEATRYDAASAADLLLDRWSTLSTQQKTKLLAACRNRTAWAERLIEAVAAKRLALAEIDVTTTQQLANHPQEKIRSAAAKAFAAAVDPDRAAVVAKYVAAVDELLGKSAGDAGRGREAFAKSCGACHKVGDVGQAVGPDLLALSDRSSSAMLTSIFDPNRAVESKFFSHTAVTDGGLTIVGLLVAEDAATITLAAADGKRHTVRRDELEQLVAGNRSFMPVGMEKDVSPAAAADVLAFLAASQSPPKSFAGNQPRLVQPEALRGELYLTPDAGAAYGETIDYAAAPPRFTNWRSPSDRAEWEFEITVPGTYELSLEYGALSGVGTTLVVDCAGTRFTARPRGTVVRGEFRTESLGNVTLEAGRKRLVLRSEGADPPGADFELASLRLRRK